MKRSRVAELLDQLADGSVSVEDVAEEFASRSWPKGRAQSGGFLQAARRVEEDPDPVVPGSWEEVSAAYAAGKISDDQYAVLYRARTSR